MRLAGIGLAGVRLTWMGLLPWVRRLTRVGLAWVWLTGVLLRTRLLTGVGMSHERASRFEREVTVGGGPDVEVR
ncbi:hypothetical protein A6A25_27670 [Saccharothrix sp. CB00851]|nr:hypothetical protein A6A25_27670 [Saccharothrix sp. CB00851]